MSSGNKSAYDMIYLAGCVVNRITPDCSRIESMDLDSVFEQSHSCSLSALTYAALESLWEADRLKGTSRERINSTGNQETLQKWKKDRDDALYRRVRFDIEREQLLSFLEEAGIWYLPLKGIVLKDFYPEPWMRREADNDILYDTTYQKQVRQWFVDRGYQVKSYRQGIEDDYLKLPCYNFEMHTAMVGRDRHTWFAYYENVKDRLIPDEGKSYAYHLTDEDFYIYGVIHCNRHYTKKGTGLRSLLDSYVYTKTKNADLDWEYIQRELAKLEVDEFERQMREVSWKIFDDPQSVSEEGLSEEERDFLETFLSSPTYGTYENMVRNTLKEMDPDAEKPTGWTKFRYVLRRAFPNAEFMAVYAPILARHKWLLPAGYVYRIIRTCCKFPGRARSEFRTMRNMTTEEPSAWTKQGVFVTEKPAGISLEDIYQALREPLGDKKTDRETYVSAWEQSLTEKGECFVALHGEEIVGTLSVVLRKRDCWYRKGEVAFCLYVRVASEWQGCHIFSGLLEKALEYAGTHECAIVELRVGAGNRHAIAVYRHHDFRAVKLLHPKHRSYAVRMAKFLEEEPHRARLRLTDMAIRILLPFYWAARYMYHTVRRKE